MQIIWGIATHLERFRPRCWCRPWRWRAECFHCDNILAHTMSRRHSNLLKPPALRTRKTKTTNEIQRSSSKLQNLTGTAESLFRYKLDHHALALSQATVESGCNFFPDFSRFVVAILHPQSWTQFCGLARKGFELVPGVWSRGEIVGRSLELLSDPHLPSPQLRSCSTFAHFFFIKNSRKQFVIFHVVLLLGIHVTRNKF